MANHVYFYGQIFGNFDALSEIYEKVRGWQDDGDQIQILRELYEYRGEIESDYDFFIQRVGAKWCNMEEIDLYTEEENPDNTAVLTLNGYSAWHPPDALFDRIYTLIYEKDETSHIVLDYDDEAYNFVGRDFFYNGEHHEKNIDNDELIAQGFLVKEDPSDIDSYYEMDWDELHEERERWSQRIIKSSKKPKKVEKEEHDGEGEEDEWSFQDF